jgi:antitoxin VapB
LEDANPAREAHKKSLCFQWALVSVQTFSKHFLGGGSIKSMGCVEMIWKSVFFRSAFATATRRLHVDREVILAESWARPLFRRLRKTVALDNTNLVFQKGIVEANSSLDEPGRQAYASAYATEEAMTLERRVKLFRNGRNQAVRIPREFEFPGEDAVMRKEGESLILSPAAPKSLLAALARLAPIDEDFPPIPDSLPERVEL